MISRRAATTAISTVCVLGMLALANAAGLIVVNATTSVPRGLYLRTDPDRAAFVTFCLGKRHHEARWYSQFCGPENPNGRSILKRIKAQVDNQFIVVGDGPRALDSKILGPIQQDEIVGWWRPLVQIRVMGSEHLNGTVLAESYKIQLH